MTARIRIALSKGRILEETLPLLKVAGIELLEEPSKSRKLIVPTSDPNVCHRGFPWTINHTTNYRECYRFSNV